MNDLRPYLCTFPDCPTAEKTYASRSSILDHEIGVHELEVEFHHVASGSGRCLGKEKTVLENPIPDNEIACLFCGETLPRRVLGERARHVGRHMEEIVFSVLTKRYEDWDFYTESSRKSDKDAD